MPFAWLIFYIKTILTQTFVQHALQNLNFDTEVEFREILILKHIRNGTESSFFAERES